MLDPRPYKYRYLLLTLCSLECLVLPCVFYGWNSLVYVLKEEGFYLELCNVEETNSTRVDGYKSVTCGERDLQFSRLFAWVSTALSIGAFFFGKVQLFAGTRVTRIICTSLFVTGCCLIAFATSERTWMLVMGMCLITPAGLAGIAFISCQTAVLFASHSPAVVALVCGMLDTSCALQFLIKTSYEAGISRKTYFLGLGSLSLITLPTTMFLLPKGYIEYPEQIEKKSTDSVKNKSEKKENGQVNQAYDSTCDNVHPFDNFKLSQEVNVIALDSCKSVPADGNVYIITNSEHMKELPTKTTDSLQDKLSSISHGKDFSSINGDANKDGHVSCAEEPGKAKDFKSYMLTQMCIMHLVWYGVIFLAFFYFLASLNSHLERRFSSHLKVSHFTDVFQYFQFAALPVYLICAWLHSKYYKLSPASAPFQERAFLAYVIPMSLAITFMILSNSLLLAENTSLLYASYACYVVFKALIYLSGWGYVTDLFPPRYTGFMFGCMYLMVGVASWAQYAFVYIAEEWSTFQARLIIIILCALTYLHPLNTWRKTWKKSRSRIRKQNVIAENVL